MPSTEQPLDDGARNGTEHWRELGHVRFCHWDRWLLRLALTEPAGLTSIGREFRRRASARGQTNETAEALLAQVVDLEARLAQLGLAPEAVLDEVERASTWLHDKAFRRVWHATSIWRTSAMKNTPRNALNERALRGNWGAFRVSPAPYAAVLANIVGEGVYDYRFTGSIIRLLGDASERAVLDAKSDEERMAVHRALLTCAIDAMERVDDSFGELGELFREHERQYLGLIGPRAEARALLRDLLELVVWEDYGLFSQVHAFLRALPEQSADVAVRVLASIIAELRRAGLDYQLGKARGLRQTLVSAADLHS